MEAFFNSKCPTKDVEYRTTISVLRKISKYKCNDEDIMFMLYFLCDCGYTRDDIKRMAEILEDDYEMKKRLKDRDNKIMMQRNSK